MIWKKNKISVKSFISFILNFVGEFIFFEPFYWNWIFDCHFEETRCCIRHQYTYDKIYTEANFVNLYKIIEVFEFSFEKIKDYVHYVERPERFYSKIIIQTGNWKLCSLHGSTEKILFWNFHLNTL